MKEAMKYLSLIFVSILCSLALASCGGGDDPLGPDPEPEPTEKNTLVIGDKETEIKSAGCYYSKENKGYDFVVSSEDLDLTKPIFSVPKGYCLVIDIPEKYCGKEYDIKSIDNDVDADGNGWYFYFSYVENGSVPTDVEINKDKIQSGKLLLNIGLHKRVECKLSVVLNDGKKLECSFTGKYQKSEEYIFNWSM